MDIEIDEAMMELLKLKSWDYTGIDIRIRDGKSNTYTVSRKEEEFPENTSDDDIARLKEKLELLKQIEEVRRKLREMDADKGYFPIRYPPREPYITWEDTNSTTDNIKINWRLTYSDGNRLW